jgi:hypothetical protein
MRRKASCSAMKQVAIDCSGVTGCFRCANSRQRVANHSFNASKLAIYNRLEIVIHHALGHAAEEGEGTVMRVEYHLLGLSGVGHDEHLAAECQPEMRDLDRLHDASEFDVLMAPVELTGLAGGKCQWNEGLR